MTVQLVSLALKALEDHQDCQDFPEHQEFQVFQDRTGPQAPRGYRVAMAPREREGFQERVAIPDQRDVRDPQVCQGKRVTQVTLLQTHGQGQKEEQVFRVFLDTLAFLDPADHLAQLVPLAPEDMRVFPVHLVLPVLRGTWD